MRRYAWRQPLGWNGNRSTASASQRQVNSNRCRQAVKSKLIGIGYCSMKTPRVSVVMPTHNGLPFLDESIRSILDQTFNDFEFVILDDASTDGSDKVLREWEKRDNRIRLFKNNRKLGLPASSNVVVLNSSAPLVARMDADDISHPERLQRQWDIMQTQPDVVAVGTLCEGIDASGRPVRPR